MEEIKTGIYQKVVGQIIRALLMALATYAFAVGVDEKTYGEFIAVTVNIVTPIVITLIVQIWGILEKRTAEYRAHYALAAPVGTTIQQVDEMVSKREPPAVNG